ncbi:MAG: hypothetical protein Q8L66_14670 [Caulobacter sp.]|nr:hypothetical protein [Caulobacter sp.]
MKKTFALALAMALLMAGNADAVQKYYVSIGCYPNYKMYRIPCDVGTTWQVCGAAFCKGLAMREPSGDARSRALSPEQKLPRLLAPLPADVQ